MATSKSRTSSFSRNLTAIPSSNTPGLKYGLNGMIFISSGIPDLDEILGGGFALGSLVMVMEDAEAPHHMLLLRNFMSQGLIHKQPLLYASPPKDPKGFLGTLPSPRSCKDDKDKSRDPDPKQESGGLLGNISTLVNISRLLIILEMVCKSTAMTLTCRNL